MKEIKVLQGAVTHEGRPDPWGGGKREHGDFRDENPPEIDWMETNPVVGQIDTHPLNTTKNLPEVDWSDTTLDIDDQIVQKLNDTPLRVIIIGGMVLELWIQILMMDMKKLVLMS